MRTFSWALLFGFFQGSLAYGHGTSKSYADWNIEGDRAQVTVNFASHDLTAAIEGLDENSDRKLSEQEFTKKRHLIAPATLGQNTLMAGEDKATAQCVLGEVAFRTVATGGIVSEVQVSAQFRCPSRVGALLLKGRYLPTLEPPHVSVATITAGATVAQHVFTAARPEYALQLRLPPLSETLRADFVNGLLAAFASLLFLLALLLPERPVHAVLLALGFVFIEALGVFGASPGGRVLWLELLLAAGVLWAGLELAFAKRAKFPLRKLVIMAPLAVLFGMNAAHKGPSAMLSKIAFSSGVLLLPLLLLGLAVLLGSVFGRQRDLVKRPVGAVVVASGLGLFVFALV